MTVAFAQQRARLLIGTQPDDRRGVDGMDGPPLTTQAHRLDRQALEAPSKGPIEQRIQRYLTALPGTFDPMPAPAQLEYVGQGSASQAPLMVDELTGKHSDEHDADKISGASRQSANQVVNSTIVLPIKVSVL
jgi:hypothetical protein